MIKESKPEIRSKICKGHVLALKNTIVNGSIYCFNCKNNSGKNQECTAYAKEHLL